MMGEFGVETRSSRETVVLIAWSFALVFYCECHFRWTSLNKEATVRPNGTFVVA
jgi:hypothetical protein